MTDNRPDFTTDSHPNSTFDGSSLRWRSKRLESFDEPLSSLMKTMPRVKEMRPISPLVTRQFQPRRSGRERKPFDLFEQRASHATPAAALGDNQRSDPTPEFIGMKNSHEVQASRAHASSAGDGDKDLIPIPIHLPKTRRNLAFRTPVAQFREQSGESPRIARFRPAHTEEFGQGHGDSLTTASAQVKDASSDKG
jgi:hypothetical protein